MSAAAPATSSPHPQATTRAVPAVCRGTARWAVMPSPDTRSVRTPERSRRVSHPRDEPDAAHRCRVAQAAGTFTNATTPRHAPASCRHRPDQSPKVARPDPVPAANADAIARRL